MKRPILLASLFLILLTTARAEQNYTIAVVDIPNGIYVQLAGINSYGDTVGSYQNTAVNPEVVNGFLRRADGSITYLNYPQGAAETAPSGISDSGVIVGSYTEGQFPKQITYGYIYSAGEFHSVQYGGLSTLLQAISTDNRIVGDATSASGRLIPFSMTAAGEITQLPVTANDFVFLYGVNNSGAIVGDAVPIGAMRPISAGLFLAPGATSYTVVRSGLGGINDEGVIVGGKGTVPFILAQGKATPFAIPGGTNISVNGINNSGVLVGQFTDASGLAHGFIATPAQ